MVITVLSGGLGNQMFQYALGLRLCDINNSKHVLDISELRGDSLRKYALNQFNIDEKLIEKNPLELGFIERLTKGIPKHFRNLREITEFQFDTEIMKPLGDVRTIGYWQNPAYFEDIRPLLLEKFSLKKKSATFNDINSKIESSESASLHVRRGDYAHNPETNKVHGTCTLEYYLKAIERIEESGKKQWFVFSDDLEWCREQFSYLENVIFAKSENDAEDMILMSHCKHNVIANSSFSWWGAWLNQNPDKTVVAPMKWLNATTLNPEPLFPKTWIRI